LNVDESSLLPLTTPRYFLDFDSYLNPETTVNGRVNQRQILDLAPRARRLGLRLRQETLRVMTRNPQANSEADLVETRSNDTFAATLRSNPAEGWDAELEGSLGSRREKVSLNAESGFEQETRLRDATARGGRRFRLVGGRGRISAEVTYSRETGVDREASGWVLRPRAQWSLPAKGRLDLRYTWTRLTVNRGFSGIIGPGAPSLTAGQRLDLVGELRVSRYIVFTGAMGVNQIEGLDRVVEGRVEARGTF
jgi:hypothetical protein